MSVPIPFKASFLSSRARIRKALVASLIVLTVVGGFVAKPWLRQHRQKRLVSAAGSGDLATVRQCLDAGASVDPLRDSTLVPALFNASYGGHVEVVRFLLDRGANPNLMSGNPLLAAIYQRHPEVVRLLLDHGANPNLEEEGTPLSAAKSTGQDEIVHLLRQRGAKE